LVGKEVSLNRRRDFAVFPCVSVTKSDESIKVRASKSRKGKAKRNSRVQRKEEPQLFNVSSVRKQIEKGHST